jgi:hypothetical protein
MLETVGSARCNDAKMEVEDMKENSGETDWARRIQNQFM